MSIPKSIHYCWFGNGEKSELIKKCIYSWKKYAPDCEIIEWNEHNYDITKNKYMAQAYAAKRWGFVSDYARLDIIYEHGGIYLDTDVELIRPIDELIKGTGFCGYEKANDNGRFFVNTGSGFGAQEKDDTILHMRDYYKTLSFYNSDQSENLQPTPLYNTNALTELGLRCDNTMQMIGNITVYPFEYFCPIDWKTHKCNTTTKTYSIHHFDASWITEEEKKRRRRARQMDWIKHTPNRIGKRILGKKRYAMLKGKIKE